MSREVKNPPESLEDLKFLAERNQLPQDIKDNVDDELIQKLVRGEKVKIPGFGKTKAGDGDDEGGDKYETMGKPELKAELASRVDQDGAPLALTGTNAEMIERLRENDKTG